MFQHNINTMRTLFNFSSQCDLGSIPPPTTTQKKNIFTIYPLQQMGNTTAHFKFWLTTLDPVLLRAAYSRLFYPALSLTYQFLSFALPQDPSAILSFNSSTCTHASYRYINGHRLQDRKVAFLDYHHWPTGCRHRYRLSGCLIELKL